MNITKIIAYITAYNDLDAIQKCISAIQAQSYPIQKIYVIDNSHSSLQCQTNNSDIVIEHHPENIGVAGGINFAIQWAIENDFEFLWTFDQDSYPKPDTLKVLLSEYQYLLEKNIPVGIIAPAIIDCQTQGELPNGYLGRYRFHWKLSNNAHYYREKLYRCDVVITSGSLINLQAAKNIPLPNPDLFIDGVDWEYCLNMRKNGYHICVSEKVTMQHNFGTYLTHLNKDHPIYIYSPLRYYYINRNHTFIETRLVTNLAFLCFCFVYRTLKLLKSLIKVIVFEPDYKILKIRACLLGFIHGLLGNTQKRWIIY